MGPLTDAEMALQLLVVISDGGLPAEFSTARAFFAAIGLASTPRTEHLYEEALFVRSNGIPFERFDPVRVVGDLTGWDDTRTLIALAEAAREGWLMLRPTSVVLN